MRIYHLDLFILRGEYFFNAKKKKIYFIHNNSFNTWWTIIIKMGTSDKMSRLS
jgi:hypothetical protein